MRILTLLLALRSQSTTSLVAKGGIVRPYISGVATQVAPFRWGCCMVRSPRVIRFLTNHHESTPPKQQHDRTTIIRSTTTWTSAPLSSFPPLRIRSRKDMEEVGGVLANLLFVMDNPPRGIIILLEGDLGAGKTTFTRGFLRAALDEEQLRVTSPTFLLSNTYRIPLANQHDNVVNERSSVEVHHMDLYRLKGVSSEEFRPLNLSHVYENCIAIIEWPIRLPADLQPPEDKILYVDIRMESAESNIRVVDKPSENNKLVGDSDADGNPRLVAFSYRLGTFWSQMMDDIQREGYLDDMLVVSRQDV